MRITITQHTLASSPIPVQSCFFCGMPVSSETARALSDAESDRLLGWSCPDCLHGAPEQLQQILAAQARALRESAARLARQADAIRTQADVLEHIVEALSQPLTGEDTRVPMAPSTN